MVTATTVMMSEEAYREFALGDPQSQWELVDGQVREIPGMSADHSDVAMNVVEQLLPQLDRREYVVRLGQARLRVSATTYYIPDVAVIPTALVRPLRGNPRALDAYADPVPLVVENWSPSTGAYDVGKKIPDYRRRGDHEIWFIHPCTRTLTAWRRQPDGMYTETIHREGTIAPASLPGVHLDLDPLVASPAQ